MNTKQLLTGVLVATWSITAFAQHATNADLSMMTSQVDVTTTYQQSPAGDGREMAGGTAGKARASLFAYKARNDVIAEINRLYAIGANSQIGSDAGPALVHSDVTPRVEPDNVQSITGSSGY